MGATEALEAAYPNLMAIGDPDELRQEALAIIYPFRRDLGEAFGRFELIISTKDTIPEIQKFITDWMLGGMGLSAGKTDRPKGHRAKSLHKAPQAWQWKEDRIRLAVAEDIMEAIASEMAEDPDDRFYDQLTEDQKRTKKLAEDAGFDVKIIVEASMEFETVIDNPDGTQMDVIVSATYEKPEEATWGYAGGDPGTPGGWVIEGVSDVMTGRDIYDALSEQDLERLQQDIESQAETKYPSEPPEPYMPWE